MDRVPHVFTEPLLVLTWIGFWIAASILYRKSRGKPIYPREPDNALYFESWASGHSRRNVFTVIGGARNCLMVAVTPEALIVRPRFPFNLLFLPEIYDLEYEVPRKSVCSVKTRDGLFNRSVRIELEPRPGERRTLQLQLKNRDEFLRALDRDDEKSKLNGRQRVGSRRAQRRPVAIGLELGGFGSGGGRPLQDRNVPGAGVSERQLSCGECWG